MFKFSLRPSPKASFEVTKASIVTTLLIFIGLFAIYKTYTYSRVADELLYMKARNEVEKIKDLGDKATLDGKFTKNDYCGWEVIKNGEVTHSENYLKRNLSIPVFTYEDVQNMDKGKISICMKEVAVNDDSVGRNVFGILMVLGIIYFLIKKDDADEKKTRTEE